MDITVYLPDELGQEAKNAGLNLSGLLREAVGAELGRQTRAQAEGAEVYVVELDDGTKGRITGRLLDEDGSFQIYLTQDERVLVYEMPRGRVEERTIEEARQLAPNRFPKALLALGVTPTRDL